MVSARPYRGALAVLEVAEHIREESGRAFDPDMVGAFTWVLDRGWLPESLQWSGMVHA